MIAGTTGRFRFAPILASVVLTILLLWMVGRAADIFLLLFLAILISLYLGAVTDFFQTRARLPRWLAFIVALFGTLGAIVGMFWLLVPPVIAQTQELLTVLPHQIEIWEQGIDNMVSPTALLLRTRIFVMRSGMGLRGTNALTPRPGALPSP